MFENVATFPTFYKTLRLTILQCLKDEGYWVEDDVICERDYVPHRRERWYLVAIRRDVKRKKVPSILHDRYIPTRVPRMSRLVTKLPMKEWRLAPHMCAQSCLDNVLSAYNEVGLRKCNPFAECVVVDMQNSEKISNCHYAIEECPALERTRCSTFGYWCTTKGGPLDVPEMAALQGLNNDDFDWERQTSLHMRPPIASAIRSTSTSCCHSYRNSFMQRICFLLKITSSSRTAARHRLSA